jgi:hypothetical protein
MRTARKFGAMVGGALFTLLLTAVPALGASNYPPNNPPAETEISRNSGADAVTQEVAFTGAEVTMLLALVAVLLAVGVGALLLARRRAVEATG